MKIILIVLSLVAINNSFARCNGYYADDILAQRYDCGSKEQTEKMIEDLHNNQDYSSVFSQVSNVCMSGCYDAIFNKDLKPECDKKYSAVVGNFNFKTPTKCKDNGVSVQGVSQNQSKNSPDNVCRWYERTTVDMTCGSVNKNDNICSNGGRAICSGVVICDSDSELVDRFGNKQALSSGTWGLTCLSKSGFCDPNNRGPKISDCMLDENVSIYSDETLKISPNESNGNSSAPMVMQ